MARYQLNAEDRAKSLRTRTSGITQTHRDKNKYLRTYRREKIVSLNITPFMQYFDRVFYFRKKGLRYG